MLNGLAMFWSTFFGWMPPILAVLFVAFIQIMLVIFVFKLLAFLMDVLPLV